MFEGTIKIKKAILHVVDRKDSKLRLSDVDLKLNDKISNLINKHILSVIKDSNRFFANFKINNNEKSVLKSCVNIFNNSDEFINESKYITELMDDSMNGTNASSANLLIISYNHGKNEGIAIIKLNFSDSFYANEIKMKDGRTQLEIVINSTTFHEKQKIEKCTLINFEEKITKPLNILNSNIEDINLKEYMGMIVLDKQNNDVSDYFANKFLNVELHNEKRESTKKMLFILNDYIENNTANSQKFIEQKFEVTKLFSNNKQFKLDEVLIKLFDDEEDKKNIQNKINEEKISANFEIDNEYIHKRNKETSITTENGVIIKLPSSLTTSNIECNHKKEYEEDFVDIILKKVKILK